MANKSLFNNQKTKIPATNAINAAGGIAYKMEDELALSQLANTGMLGDTFYTDAEDQLNEVLALARKVSPTYLAKLAIYAREQGKMKDLPSLLCTVLFGLGENALLAKVFPRVIDNGRMLRNFVQMVRSGKVGRKSLGSFGKRLVQAYFDRKSPEQLFRDTVGNDPSLADVIKLAHPKPGNATRQALYRHIIGKELNEEQFNALPELVRSFEHFKTVRNGGYKGDVAINPPDVPFQMLTALPLTTEDWKKIALNGNWHFVRMNLNTFARHGVLADREVVKALAAKLRDPESIRKAKVFPYQLLIAFVNTEEAVPAELRNALQDAMEIATQNVPQFPGEGVLVFPDVSSSMNSSVSNHNGVASKVTCLDVAGLFSAAILRKNPNAEVVPFDTRAHKVRLNGRDSVMTNANVLRGLRGGGTSCSVALADANARKVKADVVVYVSDNQSWVDAKGSVLGDMWSNTGTETMHEWRKFKARNPQAKLININITPYTNSQVSNDKDILNIGGFSDSIFETIEAFVTDRNGAQWVETINKISLE